MKKISTLFVVTYHEKWDSSGIISDAVRSENSWVFDDSKKVVATVKFDGSSAMVLDGKLYKRYDAKKGKCIPIGAIPCQEAADPISGHFPHWILCSETNPADRYFIEAFTEFLPDGTYELCGEQVGINAEKIVGHMLIPHGKCIINIDFSFDAIKEYLSDPMNDIEGIVFHHQDGRMCKIRKGDFGISRGE